MSGSCRSFIIRSQALASTGASAIRRKSSAAASGSDVVFPTETIRSSSGTTSGFSCEAFSSTSTWRSDEAERVASGAVHLRQAAEGERILQVPRGLRSQR